IAGSQPRKNLAALDISTGKVTSWNPTPSGTIAGSGHTYIKALAVASNTVYVSGSFTNIADQPRNGLAALDATTGNATAWDPNPDALVETLAAAGDTVYVAGFFFNIGGQHRSHIAALEASTGSAKPWNPNAGNYPFIRSVVSSFAVSDNII